MRQTRRVDRWRVRQVANLVNGSTLLGCAVATLGGARVVRGPRRLLVATGYRLPVPVASAFTVGNVITTRHDRAWLDARPALMRHEERHTWQYVACLGLPMLPLYLLAAGWSYLCGGDIGVHNPFERLAGLEDGGYPSVGPRARRRAQPA
jgi:hypothetical protein